MRSPLKKLILAASAAFVLAGCVEPPEGKGTNLCEGAKCETPTTVKAPLLKGAFVSGHLGNYRDCPGGGFVPASGDMEGLRAEGAAPEGDCAEDQCGVLNCQDAQVSLRLSNNGDLDATGIQIAKIEIYTEDGEFRGDLPVIDTFDTEDNLQYEGGLAINGQVSLRVDFLGPDDPFTLLAPAEDTGDFRLNGVGGILHITIEADNHADVVIETPIAYSIPSIDT